LPLPDATLRQLAETPQRFVRVVGDIDHRLFAASPASEQEWGCRMWKLLGQPI